jgi:predicted nucleic acid-binding protein
VKETYCLDACALITHFKQEPGIEIVMGLFRRAASGEVLVCISAINLSEIIYNFRKEMTDSQMAGLWQDIRALPITVVREITDDIIDEAARLKSRNKMSHADAIGLATAVSCSATFVTSDHDELEPVEQHENISFLWLPPRPKK